VSAEGPVEHVGPQHELGPGLDPRPRVEQHVLEEQGGYRWLDVAARTITGQAHRPSYGTDGDYFSKPNAEQIIDVIQEMMSE